MRIEAVDQAMFVWADVGSERLGRTDQDLVGVGPEHHDGLFEPDEIARVILSLASDAASFVTGQIVTVDGGKTAG